MSSEDGKGILSSKLYIGRDLLISGRTGLKQSHLTLRSLPHHLYSPFHTSVHAHTHTQKPNEASLHRCQFKASPVAPRKPLPPTVCLSRHQILEAPFHTGWLPSSLTASCNGSQGDHMNQGGRGRVVSDGSWFAQSHLLSHVFPRHSGIQSLLSVSLKSWEKSLRPWFCSFISFSTCPSSRGWPVLQSHIVQSRGVMVETPTKRGPCGWVLARRQYHGMDAECPAPSTPALLTGECSQCADPAPPA